jgi:type 1 glutamine amidotransferase
MRAALRLIVGTVTAALLVQAGAGAQESKKRRILFFTKSAGFEHSVIKRTGDAPSHAGKVVQELAGKNGWEVTETKDGTLITKEGLAKYDAFFFYTTGDLTKAGNDKQPPMSAEGKAALIDAVAAGKGFIGSHCAADTFHTGPDHFVAHGEKSDPYLKMVGGEFIRHGKQQKARMTLTDPKFPGCAGIEGGFEMHEEWYSFKDYAPDIHVILAQETDGMAKRGGDSVYDRPPYPATWARKHGKGRVFYTSMGHREDVWTNPVFQEILTGGIRWSLGDVEADVTPNAAKVTPHYTVIPPKK